MVNRVTPGPVPTPVDNLNTEGVTPKVAPLKSSASHLRVLNFSLVCLLVIRKNLASTLSVWFHLIDYLTLGYIDQTLLDLGQRLYYFPIVDNSGFWKVDSTVLTVNGKTIDRPGNTAVCDTGTTLILVDSSTCAAIYEQVPGSKSESLPVPCFS